MSARNCPKPKDTYDLMDEYGVTEFELDLVKYSDIADCKFAETNWKDLWEFCPVCGGEIGNNGTVFHRSSKQNYN